MSSNTSHYSLVVRWDLRNVTVAVLYFFFFAVIYLFTLDLFPAFPKLTNTVKTSNVRNTIDKKTIDINIKLIIIQTELKACLKSCFLKASEKIKDWRPSWEFQSRRLPPEKASPTLLLSKEGSEGGPHLKIVISIRMLGSFSDLLLTF